MRNALPGETVWIAGDLLGMEGEGVAKKRALWWVVTVLALMAARGGAAPVVRWQPLNEPGSGGWITSILASPHDAKRILLGGDMLGVGLSTDGGATWSAATGFRSWEIGDFTWHPTDPRTAWVGTMSGPYVSHDGGTTWAERRAGMPPAGHFGYTAPIEKVLFDPTNSHRLIAIGGSSRRWESIGSPAWGAIWESRDDGANWRRLATITAGGSSADPAAKGVNVNSAGFAAGSGRRLYAAVRGVGALVSEDGGATWSVHNDGLPSANVERVAPHPYNPNVVYVSLACAKLPGHELCVPGGIYRSDDGGRHWSPRNDGLRQSTRTEETLSASYKGFAMSPSNPDVMVASDEAWDGALLYRTVDGGKSWRAVAGKQKSGPNGETPAPVATAYPSGASMTVMSLDPRNPDVAYAGGAEYVLATRDGGAHWTDVTAEPAGGPGAWRGRGYSGLCCESFRFDPWHKGRAVLVAMDAGKLLISDDDLRSWRFCLKEPDPWGGGHDAVFAKDGTVYSTAGQFGKFAGIGRSRDGGKTWQTLSAKTSKGLPAFQENAEPWGIYTLPDDSKQVWACVGGRLLHSADGGNSWSVANEGPGLRWIAADPRSPRRFYVSAEKEIYVTEDGEHLTPIGGPRSPARMAVDSRGRLYAASYTGDDAARGGLWRYADGAWTRLREDSWTYNVAVDPANPNRLAVVTHTDPYMDISHATGVWLSEDAGKTWTQANAGLPVLRGHCIAFDPFNTQRLVFGSVGRGFFVAEWAR